MPFIVKAVSRVGKAHWLSDAGMHGIRTFAPKERAEVFSTRDDAHDAIGTMPREYKNVGVIFSIESAD